MQIVSGTVSRRLSLRSSECRVFFNISYGNSQSDAKQRLSPSAIAASIDVFSTSVNPVGPEFADNYIDVKGEI